MVVLSWVIVRHNCISSGFRTNAASTDFSAILPEDVEEEVKEAAEISMGTEVSQQDIDNIKNLCEQVRLKKW